jgi:hypothetical protein
MVNGKKAFVYATNMILDLELREDYRINVSSEGNSCSVYDHKLQLRNVSKLNLSTLIFNNYKWYSNCNICQLICLMVCHVYYYFTHTYSKIQLIQVAQDRTGAQFIDVPDYLTVLILAYVLRGNFVILLLNFDCTSNYRSIPFEHVFHLLV